MLIVVDAQEDIVHLKLYFLKNHDFCEDSQSIYMVAAVMKFSGS